MKDFRYVQVRRLGEFEKAELEIFGVIEDPKNPAASVKDGITFVGQALYGVGEFEGAMVTSTPAKTNPSASSAATPSKPEEKVTKTTNVGAASSKEQDPPKDKPVEEKVDGQKPADTSKTEVKEEGTQASEGKAPGKKRGSVNKNTAYNREDDKHKSILGSYLDSKIGENWRTDQEKLKKVGPASRAMVGKDFLDAEGELLESFCKDFMGFYEGN